MENLVIEKGITFYSQDYSDAMMIDTIKIEFNSEDIENIKKAINILNENRFIVNLRIPISSNVIFLDEGNNGHDGWRVGADQFIVYNDMVYYYAQNKYDAGDQIESEVIKLTELGII